MDQVQSDNHETEISSGSTHYGAVTGQCWLGVSLTFF